MTNSQVTSGILRGLALRSPGAGTHPMGAREKLALFNMVEVAGCRVLDAYAGSGALGLEALSRGATEVAFVEKSPVAARCIRENLRLARERLRKMQNGPAVNPSINTNDAPSNLQIFSDNVSKFAAHPEFQAHFEVIFADPPYDLFSSQADIFAETEALAACLAPRGTFILSSPAALSVPEHISVSGSARSLTLQKSRTYASARLSIYA